MSKNNELDIESLCQGIANSFSKANKKGGGIYKDILKFEKGKDYIVRLLPYRPAPEKTIHHYTYRGWKSKSTGKYVEFVDPPATEVNPIQVYSSKLTDELRPLKLDKDDPRMKNARNLWNNDAWLMNCYVISDPSNPDNEGEVKILKMGKQIWDIVHEHYEGDRKDEFGFKIVNPTAAGCNFKIRAVDNGGGYAKYDKSYFMTPSTIEGVSDNPDALNEILDACFDLETVFPVKSTEELEDAIKVHFLGESDDAPTSFADIDSVLDDDGQEEEVEQEEEQPKPKNKAAKKTTKKKEEDSSDFDVDAMLADL
jgi:hypothetical protein